MSLRHLQYFLIKVEGVEYLSEVSECCVKYFYFSRSHLNTDILIYTFEFFIVYLKFNISIRSVYKKVCGKIPSLGTYLSVVTLLLRYLMFENKTSTRV